MCCRHNDLAYELRDDFKNQLGQIDLLQNTSGQYGAAWQTDIPRLRAGHVGGQVGLLTELANQSASTFNICCAVLVSLHGLSRATQGRCHEDIH